MSLWDACQNGNLHFIQEYIRKENNSLKIASVAFGWLCQNGYLKFAKWLKAKFSINMHINNDFALRRTCRYGHLKVAKYLLNVDRAAMKHFV